MARHTLAGLFILGMFLHASNVHAQKRYLAVDMSGRDCFNADDRSVTDNDVYTLYSEYKINTQPTVDHCDVSLRAAVANRRIRYYVDKLTIFDCGIEILLFDNPDFLTIPSRTLRCQDDKLIPIVGTSTHGVLKVSLRKQTPSANAFEFQIKVTTDFGPDMQFEADSSQFYEQPLDTGAIVGIAIAGCILVIALIGLAIYCCLKNRMDNEKYGDQASGVTSNPSVFTSALDKTGVKFTSGDDVDSEDDDYNKRNVVALGSAVAVLGVAVVVLIVVVILLRTRRARTTQADSAVRPQEIEMDARVARTSGTYEIVQLAEQAAAVETDDSMDIYENMKDITKGYTLLRVKKQ